jgi:two-component sensor histidine kinase
VIRPDGREIWLEETATAEFDATGQCVRIKGLTVDVTQRKRTDEHQRLLIAELDHRVKNVLARVATVAEYTRQSSSTIDEFIQALDGRIQSMAVAHELLSQGGWQSIRLADIVRSQLAPYATDTNTTTGGPDITLSAAAAEALAMVLQELVTNASKYGALSIPDGRVSVRWECRRGDAGEGLMIAWSETGGPSVSVPTEYGYGTSLIRELVPHELGGKVDLAFSPGGLSCTIEIPIKEVSSNLTKDRFIDPSA